jgi:Ca2+-binding EF-hand superfamily protein
MTTILPTGRAGLVAAAAMLLPTAPAQALTFISPMGEPFHTQAGEKAPEDLWFEHADTNQDGRITRAEFTADAGRFFRTLDTDHDGRIGSQEIQHYEDDIAPETLGGGESSRRGRVTRATRTAADEDNVTNTYLTPPETYDAGNMGAARFSYLDLPEPVAAADVNFDRIVSPREFLDAVNLRFDALDANHDGVLTRDELPHLSRSAGHGPEGKAAATAPTAAGAASAKI